MKKSKLGKIAATYETINEDLPEQVYLGDNGATGKLVSAYSDGGICISSHAFIIDLKHKEAKKLYEVLKDWLGDD